jgi:hypothetical protein
MTITTTLTTTTILTIAERVNAGAVWLDEHRPGWHNRTNLGRLNLADDCDCVLGQDIGDFDYSGLPLEQAAALGFFAQRHLWIWDPSYEKCGSGEYAAEYAQLTQAWRDLIAARRAGGAA